MSEHPGTHAASYGTDSCRDNLYRLPFSSPTLHRITNIVCMTRPSERQAYRTFSNYNSFSEKYFGRLHIFVIRILTLARNMTNKNSEKLMFSVPAPVFFFCNDPFQCDENSWSNSTVTGTHSFRNLSIGYNLQAYKKVPSPLTFWRRNYFFNFSTLCI